MTDTENLPVRWHYDLENHDIAETPYETRYAIRENEFSDSAALHTVHQIDLPNIELTRDRLTIIRAHSIAFRANLTTTEVVCATDDDFEAILSAL
jgi:hypothetical protein